MKLEIKDGNGRTIQTVDLVDGEYTIAVTSAKAVTASAATHGVAEQASRIGQVLLLLLFTVVVFSIDQYIETAHQNLENIVFIKNALEMFVSVVVMVGIMSLISRALTHRFQIWRCANFLLISYLGVFVWSNDLLGLRWFLPKIFWIKEVYNLLFLAWSVVILWKLMEILLVQLSRPWRKAVVSMAVAVAIIYNMINFLPFRREYSYYKINTPPPRPAILESSPVTIEKFLAEIPEN
jgi:hypothetical protein